MKCVQLELYYIDCVECKCKNLQKINTIEIFFRTNTEDKFVIEYSFHGVDLRYWKKIVKTHKENVDDPELLDEFGKIVKEDEIEKESEYYNFFLTSKDFNLYRNINLIFYFSKAGDFTDTKNLNNAIRKNTWQS